MAAYALAGKAYLAPTQVDGVSGTLLAGILEDEMYFEDGMTDQAFGTGLEPDAWTSVAMPGTRPRLVLPLQDVVAATNQLLWMLRSTGTGLASAGGNNVGIAGSPPAYSLVIRPRNTGNDEYFYAPRLSINAQESIVRIKWSRLGARFEGSALVLYPRRSADGTKDAWRAGTYSALNTYYGLPA